MGILGRGATCLRTREHASSESCREVRTAAGNVAIGKRKRRGWRHKSPITKGLMSYGR